MVPEGWVVRPLQEIATVERGRFSARPRNDPRFYGGSIPFVQTGDVARANGCIQAYSQTLNDEGLAVSRVFPKGSILLTIAANIGHVATSSFDFACPDSVVVIRPKAGVSMIWLKHALLQKQDELNKLAGQNAQKNINLEMIRPLALATPRLAEQVAIAEILDTYDLAIGTCARLIDAKEIARRGLLENVLTGKRRFSEFAHSSAVQHTRFGPRPKEWPVRKIGDFSQEISERNGSHGTWPVLSCTKHQGLVDSLTYFGKRIHSEDTSNYKVVRRGQFAYATNHIEEGSIGLLSDREAGLVSPMYTVFGCDKSVDPQFLFFLFKTDLYRHIFESTTNASVNRRGSLRWTQFSQLPVATPSIGEQKKIALCIGECDNELALLHRQLHLIKLQKRGLMQKLLTGQVRVKV